MINKLKKICVVTGTRAEYGLLSLLLKSIQDDMSLDLCIIVTGSHLSPEFGLTYKEIEKDGFRIDKKIEMVISADTSSSIAKSTGLGMIGFADALYDLKPDLMVLLGDRYEILAASFAACCEIKLELFPPSILATSVMRDSSFNCSTCVRAVPS